ncbi:Polymerase/histidinol phosphatase-like protein [Endogone sp. FLAS-F59071]|nr:Polymerase/histidinol phosphatase-like protein [Endogone sp. FLAS-F59071]|eukprot:RUS20924.1 Polymerase/histidinol phosphatase-like protein [Endogone sp. FLAS-F59071]
MPFSFHSHSGQFCSHATGKLEEVVLEAIRKGFRIYGLSEHMPRYEAKELYPEEVEVWFSKKRNTANLTVADLYMTFTSFLVEARRLQVKYRAQITLVIGTEIEYITPTYLLRLQELRAAHRIDYVVGSLHHVGGVPIDYSRELYDQALAASIGSESRDEDLVRAALFERYFDEQCAMLEAVRPDVVAHFDLIRIFEPVKGMEVTEGVWRKMTRNADIVVGWVAPESHVGLEIFLYPLQFSDIKIPRLIPLLNLPQYIISRGGKLTLSDDSHGPADVGMHYAQLHDYLETMGIVTLYHLDYDDGKLVVKELRDVRNDPFWAGIKDW